MTDLLHPPTPTSAPPPTRARAGATVAAVAVAATVVGVALGHQLAVGTSRTAVVLGAGVLAGGGLGVLALWRFEAFVLAVLVLRASLDATKLGEESPLGVDPAAVLGVALIAATALWLVGRRDAGIRAPSSPLTLAMGAFAVAGLLSVTASDDAGTSLVELTRIASVLAMLVALERVVTTRRHVRRLLLALAAAAAVPVAVAAVQALTGSGLAEMGGFARLTGTFLHPNPFAMFLTTVLLVGAATVRHVPAGPARLATAAGLVAVAACLLGTYTRGAWLAALAGLVVLAVLGVLGDVRRAALLGGAGLVVLVLAVPSVAGRFADLDEGRSLAERPSNSLAWRWDYWGDALGLAAGRPVTGIGLKMVQERADEGKPVHNDVIRAYVETGVVGLLAYGGLLTSMVVTARRAVRDARPGLDRSVAAAYAASVAALVTLSLSANVISQVVVLWYFVAVAAAGLAVGRLGAADRRAAPEVAP